MNTIKEEKINMIAVIFTYNFDTDSSIVLFDSEEKAKAFLRKNFEQELEYELDNFDVDNITSEYDEDWTYAQINNNGNICEYRISYNITKGNEAE